MTLTTDVNPATIMQGNFSERLKTSYSKKNTEFSYRVPNLEIDQRQSYFNSDEFQSSKILI